MPAPGSRIRAVTRSSAWLLVAWIATGTAPAQDPQLVRAIEELNRRNAELEARIADLELAAATTAIEEQEDEIGLVARYEDVVANFQIFGDVGFRYRNPEKSDRSHSEFAFGSLDMFLNAQVGESFRILSETVIDADRNGRVELSQERLWGMWTFSETLYAKLGTEHSPTSRWNERYHHGRWLETSISRPLLASFEGEEGILPMHRTGLELGGRVLGDFGKLEYVAAVANGRGRSPTDKQPDQDASEGKQLEFGLALTPASIQGLRIGGSFLHDDIPADPMSMSADRSRSMRELIGTANIELQIGKLMVRAEGAVIRHTGRVLGEDYDHDAGYLQFEYEIEQWTPYTRFDYRNMATGDPFYAPLDRDLDRWLVLLGARYDFLTNAAIKLELGWGREDRRAGMDEEDVLSAEIQLSWVL